MNINVVYFNHMGEVLSWSHENISNYKIETLGSDSIVLDQFIMISVEFEDNTSKSLIIPNGLMGSIEFD